MAAKQKKITGIVPFPLTKNTENLMKFYAEMRNYFGFGVDQTTSGTNEMKSHSAKAKGRRLQKLVAEKLVKATEKLVEGDITSRSSGATGEDLVMSPLAKQIYPVSVECKNIAKFSAYKFMEQAVANTKDGDYPVVVVKANREEPLAIMRLDDWIDIISEYR